MLISLVGLPGCGKSTIGREVASRLGARLLDTDQELERELGMTIAAYFAEHGEERFRDAEEACIERLTGYDDAVLATGGGAVLRAQSRRRLHERSFVAYLHYAPELLVHRVAGRARRPLFRSVDPETTLRRLYAERDGHYRASAHAVVEAAGMAARAVAERIIRHAEDGRDNRPDLESRP